MFKTPIKSIKNTDKIKGLKLVFLNGIISSPRKGFRYG